MEFPNTIKFRFAQLEGVNLQPNEDGGKAVMVVSVPLTPSVASDLGRRDQFFTEKGLCYEFAGNIGLPVVLTNYQALIESDDAMDNWYNPEKVRAFKVVHGDEAENDTSLRLEFRIHLVDESDLDSAYSLWKLVKKEKFDCTLRSRQQHMFEEPPAEEEEAALAAEPERTPGQGKRRGRPPKAQPVVQQ